MGIKSIKKLLKQYSHKTSLSKLRNQTLAIDTSIYIHKFTYATENGVEGILHRMMKQVLEFKKYNITPVYVFDGKSDDDIKIVKEERKAKKQESRQKLNQKFNQIGNIITDHLSTREFSSNVSDQQILSVQEFELDIENISELIQDANVLANIEACLQESIQLEKIARSPKSLYFKKCKEMFKLLGIPIIQSRSESDQVFAILSRKRLIDGVISEDTDMIPYQCQSFICGLGKDMQVYNIEEILKKLDLTIDQFIDWCILCGCDYSSKINGIALKNGLKLIKKYKNIEGVLDYISTNEKRSEKFTYSETFQQEYQQARDCFHYPEKYIGNLEFKEKYIWEIPSDFNDWQNWCIENDIDGYCNIEARLNPKPPKNSLYNYFTVEPSKPQEIGKSKT